MSIEKFNTLELQLEILSGCAFNCEGCHVDRNSENKTTDRMYRVAYEFVNNLNPFSIVIGSTDIFTASNSLSVLRDIRLTELIKRFDRLVVNSTMVKPNMEVLQAIRNLGMKEVQINVVIPENKKVSERYNEIVSGKIDEVKALFPELVIHPQLNLSENLVVENYEDLNNFYLRHYNQGVDFNLSFARTSNDPDQYRRALRWLRDVTSTTRASEDGSMVNQHIDVVSPHDSLERAIIFYEGQFYQIPIVYEDFIQARPKYRFEDYDDYQKKYDELVIEQFGYSSLTDECMNCKSHLPVSTIGYCPSWRITTSLSVSCPSDDRSGKWMVNTNGPFRAVFFGKLT